MHVTEYETTLVLRPDVGGDLIEAVLDKVRTAIRNHGGKVVKMSHWGKKKLAYEIQKHARGLYVHTHFIVRDGDMVAAMERELTLSENVLRFLTVCLRKNASAESFEEAEYVAPSYDEVAEDEAEDADAEDASEVDASGEAEAAPAAEASTPNEATSAEVQSEDSVEERT